MKKFNSFIEIKNGFTLLEIILATGVMSVLAGITIATVAPGEIFLKVRDAERKHSAKQIENALHQILVDYDSYVTGVTSIPSGEENAKPICKEGVSATDCNSLGAISLSNLSTEYIAEIPVDHIISESEQCTGYMAYKLVDRVHVFSANLGKIPENDPDGVCGGPLCGNGTIDNEEECDDGNDIDDDVCNNSCETSCGNGILNSGESCDDGNTSNSDGCSSTCELETTFTCSGEPSFCISTNSLDAYWPMDEGSGEYINNSLGSGNLARKSSWAHWVTDVPSNTNSNYALDLRSGAGYLWVNGTFPLMDGDQTFMIWAKPKYSSGTRWLWSDLGYYNDSKSMIGIRFKNYKFEMVAKDDYANSAIASTNTLELNNWYHIAGVKEGNSVKIYLNGALQDSDTGSPNSLGTINTNGNTTPSIGRAATSGGVFPGTIDEAMVYSRALSDQEILNIYNGPNGSSSESTEDDFCYEPCTTTFFAGQTIDVGDVTVYQTSGSNDVYVKFATEDDWEIEETQMHFGENVSNIPQTGGGNPKPGQFDYKQEHSPAVQEYIYTIDESEFTCGTDYIFAAHGDVITPGESEGAWGDGNDFSGPNWATYFSCNIQCCN